MQGRRRPIEEEQRNRNDNAHINTMLNNWHNFIEYIACVCVCVDVRWYCLCESHVGLWLWYFFSISITFLFAGWKTKIYHCFHVFVVNNWQISIWESYEPQPSYFLFIVYCKLLESVAFFYCYRWYHYSWIGEMVWFQSLYFFSKKMIL